MMHVSGLKLSTPQVGMDMEDRARHFSNLVVPELVRDMLCKHSDQSYFDQIIDWATVRNRLSSAFWVVIRRRSARMVQSWLMRLDDALNFVCIGSPSATYVGT
jgi:hypothetical protein